MIEYLLAKLIKKSHLRAVIRSKINKTSKICSGSHLVDVTIDKHTDVGYNCSILNTSIGAFCSLGSDIKIGGANHSINWVSTSPVFNKNKDHLPQKFARHSFDFSPVRTHIGNDVWIADGVMIKAGVKIGDGAVIGMGSVVTKDISAYEIWAGNPAKLIRARFDINTIDRLLKIQWWSWDDKKIRERAHLFNDVQEFIKENDINQNTIK